MNKKIMFLVIGLVLFLFNISPTWAKPKWNDDDLNVVSYKHKHAKHKHKDEEVGNKHFPAQLLATGLSVFIFDPRLRQWAVYDATGRLLKTGRGSGGRNYCSDIRRRCHTPVGEFQIYTKKGAGGKSKKFPIGRGGAPMPYCSFFYNGYAVHGSYDVRSYNASHGCIRVYPKDAKWLQTVLPIGSTIIVKPY